MNIKLNLINDYDLLLNKGDGISIFNHELGYEQLIIVCPSCGEISAPMKKAGLRFDKETQSVTPSIVHNTEFGGCGWHGFLTNGEFKDA